MMDSKKSLNVGFSSSLIDLKAELLRKKQQLKGAPRDARGGAVKSLKQSDKLRAQSKYNKTNKGVESRSLKDRIEKAEEEQTLDKSKSMLETKARLYEKLQKGALLVDQDDPEDDNYTETKKLFSQSLVNFQQKAIDEIQEKRKQVEEKPSNSSLSPSVETYPEDSYQVDEDEWTEFTDHLGRTRRCLKADLPSFLERDEELSRPENPGICLSASADDRLREMKREKWELEAEILAAKDKIHYQDVLFDEVRSHGTGYYAFAKDEATRQQQMKDLKLLSEQTAESRGKLQKEKSDRNSQLKARLKKIRDRKRAKAGLPPLPDDDDEEEEDEKQEGKEEKKKEELRDEPEEKRRREIRAWDVGKAGVFGPKPETFDELDAKWLKDRRSDRNPDFAPPPSLYSQGGLKRNFDNHKTSSSSPYSSFNRSSSESASSTAPKYQNFVRSKESLSATNKDSSSTPVVVEPKPKPFQPPQNFWKQKQQASSAPQKPIPILDEMPAPVSESSKEFDRRRGGSEIAPPPTYEYYHGESRQTRDRVPASNMASMMDAVSSGLKSLREQFESKEKQGGSDIKDKLHQPFL